MPVFPKRRFQHGAITCERCARALGPRREQRIGRAFTACIHVETPKWCPSAVRRSAAAERDRFVLSLRPAGRRHDPWRYQDVIVEDERDADGPYRRVATVFLTGRECPWRCAMCDLWRHTIDDDTPAGADSRASDAPRGTRSRHAGRRRHAPEAVQRGQLLRSPRGAGSRLRRRGAALAGLERVIVESHPALVGAARRSLSRRARRARAPNGAAMSLEVAMGLETAHPAALERLHKRMTFETFATAAASRVQRGVALRVFLLVSPPFVPPDEQDAWLLQSIERAFSCGASVVSLVPTRLGQRRDGSAGGRRPFPGAAARRHRAQRARSRLTRAARAAASSSTCGTSSASSRLPALLRPTPGAAAPHQSRTERPPGSRAMPAERGCGPDGSAGRRSTPTSRSSAPDSPARSWRSRSRRRGQRVVLVERGRHPRFAIGESSTPLANLLLEELADRYDLPRLRPFSKWGTWQRARPDVAAVSSAASVSSSTAPASIHRRRRARAPAAGGGQPARRDRRHPLVSARLRSCARARGAGRGRDLPGRHASGAHVSSMTAPACGSRDRPGRTVRDRRWLRGRCQRAPRLPAPGAEPGSARCAGFPDAGSLRALRGRGRWDDAGWRPSGAAALPCR